MNLKETKNENENQLKENQKATQETSKDKTDSNIESLSKTLCNSLERVEIEIADVGGPDGIKDSIKTMSADKLNELQEKIRVQENNYSNTKQDLALFAEISNPFGRLIDIAVEDDNLGDRLKRFTSSLFLTGTGTGPLMLLTSGIKAISEKIRLNALKKKANKLNSLN